MDLERDIKTEEQLWQDPDWECPRCHYANLAIRAACRNCGYVGGEVAIFDYACLEVVGNSTEHNEV